MDTDTLSPERYISVDIEAAGPIPGEYSMLALGACVVGDPGVSYYSELKPINQNAVPEALAASSLRMDELSLKGEEPESAMRRFRDWLRSTAVGEGVPVFVGFNAAFDWSFINWYFIKYIGENPFGFAALDIKSYFMGFSGCLWKATTSGRMPEEFRPSIPPSHHALEDAVAQGETFQKLLAARRGGPSGP